MGGDGGWQRVMEAEGGGGGGWRCILTVSSLYPHCILTVSLQREVSAEAKKEGGGKMRRRHKEEEGRIGKRRRNEEEEEENV